MRQGYNYGSHRESKMNIPLEIHIPCDIPSEINIVDFNEGSTRTFESTSRWSANSDSTKSSAAVPPRQPRRQPPGVHMERQRIRQAPTRSRELRFTGRGGAGSRMPHSITEKEEARLEWLKQQLDRKNSGYR